jgi:hypothetical protein
MRITPLLLLVTLAGCDLIKAATAEKPNGIQQNAIGDIFGQVGTVAGVIDDPTTASNGDVASAFEFDHFALLVAPGSTKPTFARAGRPAPLSECVTISGDSRTFTSCDVVLADGRACEVNGSVARVAGSGGSSYQGTLTLGGPTTCPTASLGIDVFLEGPNDSPTLASGTVSFAIDDPSGDRFSGNATIDDIAVTGSCDVPSSGELRVTVNGTRNGNSIANQQITLSFHEEPGCGIVYIE